MVKRDVLVRLASAELNELNQEFYREEAAYIKDKQEFGSLEGEKNVISGLGSLCSRIKDMNRVLTILKASVGSQKEPADGVLNIKLVAYNPINQVAIAQTESLLAAVIDYVRAETSKQDLDWLEEKLDIEQKWNSGWYYQCPFDQ